MAMERISPQVLVILAVAIAAVPLSFLLWKLKRLGSKRDSTLNVPPSNNNNEKEMVNKEASSSLDLGSQRDPTDEIPSVSSQPEWDSWWKYEVFLSFRGFDTRKKFVSHLDQKLKDKGIYVFKDDRELPPGHDISEILQVIEKSRMAIVVLSKNFATSTYCLDEVAEIIECRRKKGQMVLPVFYEFDPSDIEENKGSIAEAFKKHEEEYDTTKIQQWRAALSAVAGIFGWVSLERFDGDEATLINHIYEYVDEQLTCAPSSSTHSSDLVGMDFHMTEIDKQLNVTCNDKRRIGIWGPGGIGKTTIAEEIVQRYVRRFDSYCFLKNIKADYEEKDVFCRADGRKWIHQRLHLKKVLVVLDDVDDFQQLDALAGSLDWFGDGSRVIITTRNKQLLDGSEVHDTYEVPFLKDDDARKLFKIHAFKRNQSQDDYYDLINEFVTYAGRLPLALVVLGESLRGCWDIEEWESELHLLRTYVNPTINQVLRISFNRLKDKFTKDVFLDIAFFLIERGKNEVKDILYKDDCSPLRAIHTLKNKALLTIDKYGFLHMHDLMQDMAREIVKEESSLCDQCSRLSRPKDVVSMLRSTKDKSRIEGISLLDISKIKGSVPLKANVFAELCRLRILDFRMPENYCGEQVFQPQDDRLDELSHDLTYFCWDAFPFKYWPSIFIAENLVELRLRWSKLESLWSKETELGKLKVIDLSNNKCLKTFPNLLKAPNVKEIEVYGCESLIEFCSDFQHLTKVDRLDFEGCKRLDNLPLLPPNLTMLSLPKLAMTKLSSQSLMKLNILEIGCYEELTYFSMEADEVTSVSEPTTEAVYMEKSEDFQLSDSFGKLKSLRYLKLEGISITELPQSIEHLQMLGTLEIHWCTKLVRLSSNLHKLSKLWSLKIEHCKCLCSLPQLPESLEELRVNFCEALKTLEGDGWERLQKMRVVSFVHCQGLDQSARRNNLEHVKGRLEVRYQRIYPGKATPRWFEYRSEGSSITIELPSARSFFRVSLCVVFAVDKYPLDSYNYLQRHRKIDIAAKTNRNDYEFPSARCIPIQSEGVDDHIVVWSDSVRQNGKASEDNFGTDSAGIKIHIHFVAQLDIDFHDKEVKEVKVKRCGVHIFTPDERDEDTFESDEEDVAGERAQDRI